VEPGTFKDLYGIEEKDMDKAACGWVPVPLLFHTSQDKNKIQTLNIYCTYPVHVPRSIDTQSDELAHMVIVLSLF
jgi:hypothetical protein